MDGHRFQCGSDGAQVPDYKQSIVFKGIPHALAFTSRGMKIRFVVPRFSAAKTALKRLTTNSARYFQRRIP